MSKFWLSFIIQIHLSGSDFEGPLFHRWLPEGKKDALNLPINDPSAKLKIWFNRYGETQDGVIRFDPTKLEVDSELMSRQAVLCAGPILGVLEIDDLSYGQLLVIRENKIGDPDYIALGKRIIKLIYPSVSNFINILRTNFGQYWLKEMEEWDSRYLPLGMYFHKILDAQWSLDQGQSWVKFLPDNERKVTPLPFFRLTKYLELLTEEDWQKLMQTLIEDYQPKLSAFLISDVHRLLQMGEIKQALIGATTALEVAIKEHMKQDLKGEEDTLKKLQAFFELKLPALFVSFAVIRKDFSSDDIKTILELIKERNQATHEGYTPSDEIKKKIEESLRIISRLISGPTFKFPQLDLSQVVQLEENWEKSYKGEDNLVLLWSERPLLQEPKS